MANRRELTAFPAVKSASITALTISCASHAVEVAGFARTETPASRLTAAFSHKPCCRKVGITPATRQVPPMQSLEVRVSLLHSIITAQQGVTQLAADLAKICRAHRAIDADRGIRALVFLEFLRAISNQSSRRAASASEILPSNSAR